MLTKTRLQQLLSDNEVFGSNDYPLGDYKSTAEAVLEQMSTGMIIDEYELDELLYDLCSTTGSEDYEDVAAIIWDEWEMDE